MFCIGGGESISGKRAVFNRAGVECKLAVDDDKTRNIDMVPRGTSCGPNKVKPLQRRVRRSPVARVGCFGQFPNACVQVCLDNRCVDVSAYGPREECQKKCNNNGVRDLLQGCLPFRLCSQSVSQLVCPGLFFSKRCATTRESATATPAGLRPTATSSTQTYPKVQETLLSTHFGEVAQRVASGSQNRKDTRFCMRS